MGTPINIYIHTYTHTHIQKHSSACPPEIRTIIKRSNCRRKQKKYILKITIQEESYGSMLLYSMHTRVHTHTEHSKNVDSINNSVYTYTSKRKTIGVYFTLYFLVSYTSCIMYVDL